MGVVVKVGSEAPVPVPLVPVPPVPALLPPPLSLRPLCVEDGSRDVSWSAGELLLAFSPPPDAEPWSPAGPSLLSGSASASEEAPPPLPVCVVAGSVSGSTALPVDVLARSPPLVPVPVDVPVGVSVAVEVLVPASLLSSVLVEVPALLLLPVPVVVPAPPVLAPLPLEPSPLEPSLSEAPVPVCTLVPDPLPALAAPSVGGALSAPVPAPITTSLLGSVVVWLFDVSLVSAEPVFELGLPVPVVPRELVPVAVPVPESALVDSPVLGVLVRELLCGPFPGVAPSALPPLESLALPEPEPVPVVSEPVVSEPLEVPLVELGHVAVGAAVAVVAEPKARAAAAQVATSIADARAALRRVPNVGSVASRGRTAAPPRWWPLRG